MRFDRDPPKSDAQLPAFFVACPARGKSSEMKDKFLRLSKASRSVVAVWVECKGIK